MCHRWEEELRERWPVWRFHALKIIISSHDASHHLHYLSCFNGFMTANAKKNPFNISVWWQQPLRIMKGVIESVQVTLAFHLGCFFWLWSAWGDGSFRQVILPCHHTPSLTPKDACHKKVYCSTLHAKHLESSQKWKEQLFPNCSFSFYDSNTDHHWLPG